MGRSGRLLQLGQRRLWIGAALEHRRVRRDGEEVLRQPVVDLARDPRPLLRDGAAELGKANCPPDADEQDRVGEETQVVAGRDEAIRDER